MRNLPHYIAHPFKFYKSIVDRKREPGKSVLNAIEAQMKTEYDDFISYDLRGSLHLLPRMALSDSQKEHLLNCYSYKKTKEIRESVMLTSLNRLDPICPYCTIGEYKTMDHFLPKENYAAHSVNPSNLIPCCSICNGYKGTLTHDGGNRLFLNLYCDVLPEKQYLFVNFNFGGGCIPTVDFSVQNINGIDPLLFGIIERHYIKLHLLERFSSNAFNIIRDLNNQIVSTKETTKATDVEIKQAIKVQCDDERKYYGFNYWKSILKHACIDDPHMYSIISTNRF